MEEVYDFAHDFLVENHESLVKRKFEMGMRLEVRGPVALGVLRERLLERFNPALFQWEISMREEDGRTDEVKEIDIGKGSAHVRIC